MTKRAGKRKNRMGVQTEKPRNGQPVAKPPTIIEDHLPQRESIRLELRAMREGWLLGQENMDVVRGNLMKKLATMASKEDDPDRLCRMIRTLAMSEQREIMLEIAKYKASQQDLPPQVQVGVVVNNQQPEQPVTQQRPFEVIQRLLERSDVKAALTGGLVGG